MSIIQKIINFFFPEKGKPYFDKNTNTFYFKNSKGELKYPFKINDQDIDKWIRDVKTEKNNSDQKCIKP